MISRSSSKMKALCEDIIKSHQERQDKLKLLKEQSELIRDHSRRYLEDFKAFRKEMSEKLRKDLVKNRKELIDNLNSFREDFKKKEREVKRDLEEADRIWDKMKETLKAKRKEREIR